MKSSALRWLGGAGLAVLGVLCWLVFRTPPPDTTLAKKPAPLEVAKPLATQPPDKPTEDWPGFGTPEFKAMAPERIRKWIESRGRDAAGLVAAWDITGEESLLTEAAEKFPNDPRVCLAMIGKLGLAASEALPWIERLIAAEPGNPEGFYLKAGALKKLDDRSGALDALRSAVAMPGTRNTHIRDRMLTVREAALASGAGIRSAAEVAFRAPLERGPLYEAAQSAMIPVNEMEAAKAAGDIERMLELAGLGLAVASRIDEGSLLIDTLLSRVVQKSVLSELPPDTEIGASESNAGAQLEALNASHEEWNKTLKEAEEMEAIHAQATDAEIAEFTDRVILHGEYAAMRWLQQQADRK